jgi:REP element-mobilizing transposase RayT
MRQHNFKIDAIVILPAPIHALWTLPETDADFSTRWRLIKSYFSRQCHSQYQGKISTSRQHKGEKAIWQRRFWEHQVRDGRQGRAYGDRDFVNHLEYRASWISKRSERLAIFQFSLLYCYGIKCRSETQKIKVRNKSNVGFPYLNPTYKISVAEGTAKQIALSKAKMIAVLNLNQQDDGDRTTRSAIANVLLFFP